MKKMSNKTWLTLIIIVLVVIAYAVLQLRPRMAVAPAATTGETQNPYPTLDTASTTTVTLKLGDHITVGGVLLTPTEVLQDSRCAATHICIQAGTVILAVNASDENGASVIDLPLGQTVVQEGLSTTLTAVSPAASAGIQINPADYSFTLNIQAVINGGNVLNP
jgi:hypothetical protein